MYFAFAIAESQESTISTDVLDFVLAQHACIGVSIEHRFDGVLDMANPQKSAMDAYLVELTGLVADRQKLEKRITKVERVLRGMIDLLNTDEEQTEYIEKLDEIRPPAGLTEAIQQVLQSDQDKAFLPTEIRDRVKGYLLNHSNEMASVHTTLKRIVKNNPFVEQVEREGKAAYRWVSTGERYVRNLTKDTATTATGNFKRKTLGQMIAEGGSRKK